MPGWYRLFIPQKILSFPLSTIRTAVQNKQNKKNKNISSKIFIVKNVSTIQYVHAHLCHPLNINNKGSDFLPNHRISYIFFGGGNSHHMYLLEEELLFLTKEMENGL